jgi:O-antigen ligase
LTPSRTFNSARLITIFAASSITIVRLPVLLGSKTILDSLILLGLILCVGWGMSRQPRGSFTNGAAMVAFLYAAVVAVALFRGAHVGAFGSTSSAAYQSATYLLFVAFGIILVTTARGSRERDERLLAIAIAPGVYVAINIAMSLAGLQNSTPTGFAAGTPAKLLQIIGISAGRVRFPLATSINLFSIIVAAALVSVVAIKLYSPSLLSRRLVWLTITACVYCLLLGDSRGALLVAGVVIVLFVRRIRISATVVAGIVPLLPLIVIGVLALLANTGVNGSLSRGSSATQDVTTASGRLYIWEGSWEVLKHWNFQEFYGWGAAGHYTSGASQHYAYILSSSPEATKTLFTHNLVLQMLFDTGYIGLIILIVAVWSTWRLLTNYLDVNPKSPVVALMAMLLVILLSGATEVSPTYYSQEALLAVLMIMGAAAGLKSTARQTVQPRRRVAIPAEPVQKTPVTA